MVSADFRVTQVSMARKVTGNLQRSLQKLERLHEQISSNREINRPSDSPVGTVAALRLRAELGRNEQIDRNLNDATAWLATADDTLSEVVDQINRVRDLAIQANNGSLGQTERDAISGEMTMLRDSLLDLANARYLDRSVFAGTASGKAYDATTGAFIGQAASIERMIAPGVRVQINLNGEAVFGPTGADLFTVVANLATAVSTNTNIDAALANLDTSTNTVQQSLAEVGARMKRVMTMQDRSLVSAITLRSSLSQVEDIDLPRAIMEMQIQETTYQAALHATAKVIQPSLVDFLR
jgi:flagellar hook-associated protein 3 FlgL